MKHTVIFRIALSCLFCLFMTSLYAQYDNYPLNNYVTPDYKRQSLDFNVGGQLGNSSSKQTIKQGNNDSFNSLDNFSINGNTEANYNRVKNSASTQNVTNVSFLMNGGFNKLNRETDLLQNTLISNGTYQFGLSFSNQGYYYRGNKQFILFTPSVGISVSGQKYKYDDDSVNSYRNKDNSLRANTSFRLGLGKGRIEEVGDARQAVYILQDLQKQGVLKKELSNEEIDELAELITKEKYTRRLDSRIRLIQEITAIDSFMVAKGYVDNGHSVAYFTSLYDNWQFANVYRKSGNRFTFGIMPTYQYSGQRSKTVYFNNNDFTQQDTSKNTRLGMALFTGFESEKPINLYWQRSASVALSFGWQDYKTMMDRTDSYQTALTANYGLAYYPNSRTSISGGIFETLDYNFNDDFNIISSLTTLRFEMSYYFSPQFRLNLNYQLGYHYSHQDNKNTDSIITDRYRYPTNYLSVSLTYSLF